MEPTSLIIIEEDLDEENTVYKVPDKEVVNRARSTLPDILYIFPADNFQDGVFAKFQIPCRTQFGPLNAPMVPYAIAKSSPFLLKSKVQTEKSATGSTYTLTERHYYYDTSKEQQCNWMCMVRPATRNVNQNMVAHFVGEDIYFTTTRNIEANEQLKVWYAPKYAQFIGKNLLIDENIISEQETLQKRSANEAILREGNQIDGIQFCQRSKRARKPARGATYVDYLEVDGADVRNVPLKKRGWRRADRQFPKDTDISSNVGVTGNGMKQSTEVTIDIDTSSNAAYINGKRFGKPPSDVKRVFSCLVCGKKFGKKYTLKLHSTIHSDRYEFLCQSCGKPFKRKDKMQEHIKRMHTEREFKSRKRKSEPSFTPRFQPKEVENFLFKCLRCSIGFKRRGMLVNHLLKKHADIDISTVPELGLPIIKHINTFLCPYCDKTYKSNSKRKFHIEKHHPGKSAPPSIRSLKKNKSERAAGIASNGIVTLAPVSCPYCQSQYSSKSKMIKHIKVKHPEQPSNNETLKESDSRVVTATVEGTFMELNSQNNDVSEHVNAELPNMENIINMFADVPSSSYTQNNAAPDTRVSSHLSCDGGYLQTVQTDLHYQHNSMQTIEQTIGEQYRINEQTNVFQTGQSVGFIEAMTSNEHHRDDNQMGDLLVELSQVSSGMQSDPSQVISSSGCGNDQGFGKMSKESQPDYHRKLPQCARQLPMTYKRGKKLLLLQATNESHLNAHDMNTKRYVSRDVGHNVAAVHPEQIGFNDIQQRQPASVPQVNQQYDVMGGHEAVSQATPAMTPLRPCDLNWMYEEQNDVMRI